MKLKKADTLKKKAAVNAQLKEYGQLTLNSVLELSKDLSRPPEYTVASILEDLDDLNKIPSEPDLPETVGLQGLQDLQITELGASLLKETSPSSVSEEIRSKIDKNPSFFEIGTTLIARDKLTQCPLCEQDITHGEPQKVIQSYLDYFADAEQKHKNELRSFDRGLSKKIAETIAGERLLDIQNRKFEALKKLVPSQSAAELSDISASFKQARTLLTDLRDLIELKLTDLSEDLSMEAGGLEAVFDEINKKIEANNIKSEALSKAIDKQDDERKQLRRNACAAFEYEFAIANKTGITSLLEAGELETTQRAKVEALQKSGASTSSKARVADTFELLLRDFFGDKYVFDKERFVLKRGDKEMERGPQRTLSDGEKTAIAFCFFVSAVHRKVEANTDYKNLFLVFDDPVNSMSYDFVFAIAQILKNLNISDEGVVSINPATMDGNKSPRPKLLVLTHSTYLFNVLRSNRVMKEEATFSLCSEGDTHSLARLKTYVAPFEQQLEHVYRVAKGQDPDHTTGNAVRSVLEAIGRFCRPDKSASLQDFVTFLAGEDGFALKSVLIQSLSHGTYYDEVPDPKDLSDACEQTLQVVRKYAAGHIEVLAAG